jgi:polyketide synthase 5
MGLWVFSGQGSQWAAMGAELLATEPVFAANVAQAEPLIARESGFSLTTAMSVPQMVTVKTGCSRRCSPCRSPWRPA